MKKKTKMVGLVSADHFVILTGWVAEDFYGNDYPEDEVNSDDEFDRGAYNYRHGASDDEEFGEETTTWSDEEDEARPSWSTHRAHTGYGIAD